MESTKRLAELKALYVHCFNDSEQLTNHLFSTKLGIQNAIISMLNGHIVSVLYLVDKSLVYMGHKIAYPFIVALGTYQEHRGKGIASGIIREAIEKTYNQHIPFIGLYPAVEGFYEKYQFAYITKERGLCTEGLELKNTQDASLILTLYQNALSGLDFYLYRSEEDMDKRLAEISADNANAQLIYKQDKLVGYSLGSGEEYVLNCSINYNEKGKPMHGHMARVANLEGAFALTNISIPFAFRVEDTVIAQNNRVIKVHNGKVLDSKNAEESIQIEDLTALLFGLQPYNKAVFYPYFNKIKGQIAEKY